MAWAHDRQCNQQLERERGRMPKLALAMLQTCFCSSWGLVYVPRLHPSSSVTYFLFFDATEKLEEAWEQGCDVISTTPSPHAVVIECACYNCRGRLWLQVIATTISTWVTCQVGTNVLVQQWHQGGREKDNWQTCTTNAKQNVNSTAYIANDCSETEQVGSD